MCKQATRPISTKPKEYSYQIKSVTRIIFKYLFDNVILNIASRAVIYQYNINLFVNYINKVII